MIMKEWHLSVLKINSKSNYAVVVVIPGLYMCYYILSIYVLYFGVSHGKNRIK